MNEPQLRKLFDIICSIESRQDPTAYNEAEKAVGIAQIRECVVFDCQWIHPKGGFSLDDRWTIVGSWELFRCYLHYWGKNFERANDKKADYLVLARIWNGGPQGWDKGTTTYYAGKVQALWVNWKANEGSQLWQAS